MGATTLSPSAETLAQKPIEVIDDFPFAEMQEAEVITIKEVGSIGCFALCDLFMGSVAVLRDANRPCCWAWIAEHCADETKFREERRNETVTEFMTVARLKECGEYLHGSVAAALASWKSRRYW